MHRSITLIVHSTRILRRENALVFGFGIYYVVVLFTTSRTLVIPVPLASTCHCGRYAIWRCAGRGVGDICSQMMDCGSFQLQGVTWYDVCVPYPLFAFQVLPYHAAALSFLASDICRYLTGCRNYFHASYRRIMLPAVNTVSIVSCQIDRAPLGWVVLCTGYGTRGSTGQEFRQKDNPRNATSDLHPPLLKHFEPKDWLQPFATP